MAVELLQTSSRRIRALEKNRISTLGTFLSLCAHCKKIREKEGMWTPIVENISDHSENEFSHAFARNVQKISIYKERHDALFFCTKGHHQMKVELNLFASLEALLVS